MSKSAAPRKTPRRLIARWMYDRGWTKVGMDDTLRSRIARAFGERGPWYDWGHPVMWLVGRYDGGNAGSPRGRDLWWVPTEYVEGPFAQAAVAGLEVRHGCYVTTNYSDIHTDVDWRIFDLQDDGHTVKVGLWPNLPEHGGHIQPLPWEELKPATSLRLFLEWYLVDHKIKAQWFGLRSWIYWKALHAAVQDRRPFSCAKVPPPCSGGYSHWHCQLGKRHKGAHRYRNYVWDPTTDRVEYAPAEA